MRPCFTARPAVTTAPWSVSALETYLGCPFRFFAQHVLRLEEEPDDEEVMDPRRQGLFVHEVFEQFFGAWQAAGGRAITPSNLDEAHALFAATVDRLVGVFPALRPGSSARSFWDRPRRRGWAKRSSEWKLSARWSGRAFTRAPARRSARHRHRSWRPGVHVKGKANRVDLLADRNIPGD